MTTPSSSISTHVNTDYTITQAATPQPASNPQPSSLSPEQQTIQAQAQEIAQLKQQLQFTKQDVQDKSRFVADLATQLDTANRANQRLQRTLNTERQELLEFQGQVNQHLEKQQQEFNSQLQTQHAHFQDVLNTEVANVTAAFQQHELMLKGQIEAFSHQHALLIQENSHQQAALLELQATYAQREAELNENIENARQRLADATALIITQNQQVQNARRASLCTLVFTNREAVLNEGIDEVAHPAALQALVLPIAPPAPQDAAVIAIQPQEPEQREGIPDGQQQVVAIRVDQ